MKRMIISQRIPDMTERYPEGENPSFESVPESASVERSCENCRRLCLNDGTLCSRWEMESSMLDDTHSSMTSAEADGYIAQNCPRFQAIDSAE